MSPIEDAHSIAARLPGTSYWNMEVLDLVDISDSLRQITVGTPGLGSLQYKAGQDVMVSVPAEDGHLVRRRYTIRRINRSADSIDLHVLLHSSGPGANWAKSSQPGDTIEIVGPRGKIFLDDEVSWHLFVGDESALAATAAMVETIPAGIGALVAVAGSSTSTNDTFVTEDGTAALVSDVAPSSSAQQQLSILTAVLEALELPPGNGHAYVNGEFHLVSGVKDLLTKKGLQPEQIDTKSYWRSGLANEDRGEPNRNEILSPAIVPGVEW